MELQSKISLKSIGAQPKAGSLAEGEVKKLAVFYGRCTGYVTGESSFGEFVKFRGSFEAVNADTGEVYRSSNILMPDIITNLLRDALDNREDDSAALEFAIELGAKYATTSRGYEYTVVPLVQLAESDELGRLRNEIQRALPAPADEKPELDKAEPEKAPAKGKGK